MRNKTLIIISFVICIVVIYTYSIYAFTPRITPPEVPSETVDYLNQRDGKCPILKISSNSLIEKHNFEIKNVQCDFENSKKVGHDSSDVIILNQNFEQGKQEFKKWLKENGLEESDKLRITYIHKPK